MLGDGRCVDVVVWEGVVGKEVPPFQKGGTSTEHRLQAARVLGDELILNFTQYLYLFIKS
jgi:hypothetical protein